MNTLMLESGFTNGYNSRITTKHGILQSNLSVVQLLENACLRHASTLEGRIQATKRLMSYFQKPPIIIEPGKIAAFPTMSYNNLECIWIFNHLFHIEELGQGECLLTFYNRMTVKVAASKYVLIKQQERMHAMINTFGLLGRYSDIQG
ncbi:competence protein ComK [Psychrobacillus sp. FSL K6-1267]|uniref:competence protein ComK n=1 Tax=Psychrobacillus sp. FSL K6-1267 TaxID=2921543 RepID=UPI0011A3E983